MQDVGEGRAVCGEDLANDLEDPGRLCARVAGCHDLAGVVDGYLSGEHEQRTTVQIETSQVSETIAERRGDGWRVVERQVHWFSMVMRDATSAS
ncbi:hypothetical protein Jiend_04750 [Micromonospora endophytica]|nr:hypothetical protein Jiend_04750 [Micromonospora endophytica]